MIDVSFSKFVVDYSFIHSVSRAAIKRLETKVFIMELALIVLLSFLFCVFVMIMT